MIIVYVDDILLAGASQTLIREIKDALQKRFRMIDLELYLGVMCFEIVPTEFFA